MIAASESTQAPVTVSVSDQGKFLPPWIFASLSGFALVVFIGGGIFQGLDINQYAVGGAAGTLMGLLQWFVLRRYFPSIADFKWVWLTTIAWIVGFSVGFFVGESIPSHSYLAGFSGGSTGGFVGGAVSGLLQWRYILRDRIPFSGWWVTISTIAWGLGFAVGYSLLLGGILESGISYPVGIALSLLVGPLIGIIAGAITGTALPRLIAQGEKLKALGISAE